MAKWKADLPVFNGSGYTTHRFWHDSESITWEDSTFSSSYQTDFFRIYVSCDKEDRWSWSIQSHDSLTFILRSEKHFKDRVGAKNQALRKAAKLVVQTLGNLGFEIDG